MQLSRRTVLKAIAGAVMAPTVTLRKTVDREAILRAFCDDLEGCRYNLTKPIVHADHVWASNYREMILAVDFGFERDGGQDKVPPLTSTWEQLYQPMSWTDFHLPRIEELTHRTRHYGSCPLCDDRRVSYGPYYPTDQETADNLPDWDVDDNTIRDVSCPLCNGKAYRGPNVLILNGLPFQYARIKKLAMLPNCRTSLSAGQFQTGKKLHDGPALCFAGDGFSGLAMPLSEAEKA